MQIYENTYENVALQPEYGFEIRFVTMNHNSPFHWHRELEILYILNGHATVNMDGEKFELNPQDAIVIDFSKVHEVVYQLPQTMGICIHISRRLMHRALEHPELVHLAKEQQDAYREICEA